MIRDGTLDDAETLARVQLETWRAAYAHALPRDQLLALSSERWADMHRRHPPLVAEVEGAVVGFVAVGRTNNDEGDGELFALYVHRDHWDTGVGRALIEAGEEHLRELGHRRAHLWVLDDNPPPDASTSSPAGRPTARSASSSSSASPCRKFAT